MPTRKSRNKEVSDLEDEENITDANPASVSLDHILSFLQKMSLDIVDLQAGQRGLETKMEDRFAALDSDRANGGSTTKIKAEVPHTPSPKQHDQALLPRALYDRKAVGNSRSLLR